MLERIREKSPVDQRKKTRATAAQSGTPVLRLRELVVGIVCIIILIMWPLFMVWKQTYITSLSMKDTALTDSLVTLNRQCAQVRLYSERLASTERIESIGRARLGLEYPASGQIIVIKESGKSQPGQKKQTGFFASRPKTGSRLGG